MCKFTRKLLVSCIVISIVLTHTLLTVTTFAAGGFHFSRLYGMDRYKTAAAISREGWYSSSYTVIARGDDFPDALCAGPLAKKYDAPILLTEPNRLPTDTLNELKRLDVRHIIIVGGYGAVSNTVERRLRSEGFTDIKRIYGSDRYETSVEIAREIDGPDSIVLATGKDFPDALSVSAIAARLEMPILLTEKFNLPYCVWDYIEDEDIDKTYVIGGAGAIGTNVYNKVPGRVRLGGSNRYSTNVQVMKEFEDFIDLQRLYIAIGEGPQGDEFADALTGAALAARYSNTVVLTGKSLPYEIKEYLRLNLEEGSEIVVLGGEAVVPSSVVSSINAIIVGEDDSDYTGYVKYDSPGTYGPSKGAKTVDGDVVIGSPGVILRNTRIEGDLLISRAVRNGDFTLQNVTVDGTTTINGGGSYTGEMEDCSLNAVMVDVLSSSFARLSASDHTEIEEMTIASDDDYDVEFGISSSASVETLIIYSPSDITGSGYLEDVYIRSSGVTISQIPEYVTINRGYTAYIGDRKYSSGTYDRDDLEEMYKVSPVYSSPSAGTVRPGTMVSLYTSTSKAAIYYTLNGKTPYTYENSYTYKYEEPIVIEENTTIKAVAVKSGLERSDVKTFVYKIDDRVEIVRSEDSVAQDPEGIGGSEIEYSFAPSSKVLTISDGMVPYYKAVKGRTAGNWVGVAIKAPEGFSGDIRKLTIDGKVYPRPVLSKEEKDRGELWYYFKASTRDTTHTLVIDWSEEFLPETIKVKTIDITLQKKP